MFYSWLISAHSLSTTFLLAWCLFHLSHTGCLAYTFDIRSSKSILHSSVHPCGLSRQEWSEQTGKRVDAGCWDRHALTCFLCAYLHLLIWFNSWRRSASVVMADWFLVCLFADRSSYWSHMSCFLGQDPWTPNHWFIIPFLPFDNDFFPSTGCHMWTPPLERCKELSTWLSFLSHVLPTWTARSATMTYPKVMSVFPNDRSSVLYKHLEWENENMHLTDFVTLPAGTWLLTNIDDAHKNTEYWKNACEFNPQNFLDENGKYKSNEAFMPYGMGKWKDAAHKESWRYYNNTP